MSTYFQSCLFATTVLLLYIQLCQGRPAIGEQIYKDTDEILNDWNNDDDYYSEEQFDIQSGEKKKAAMTTPATITNLPPLLVQHISMPVTTPTTSEKPVYFPRTDIELGSLFDQVGKAKRSKTDVPVVLPVPYIVWTSDTSGKENRMNYWKKFYNTMYKVE